MPRIVWLAAVLALSMLEPAAAAPGDRFEISPTTLPPPYAARGDYPDTNPIKDESFLPQGPPNFGVSPFTASKFDYARSLALAPNGDVFVAEAGRGTILMLRDKNGDGRPEDIFTFAQGFSRPYGLAVRDGVLYVADTQAIWRLSYAAGDTTARGPRVRLTKAPDLRPYGTHWTRSIAVDSKGGIYLAMGGNGDAVEVPPPDATVQAIAGDGTMTTFASGLRNPVGIAFYPGTDILWVTVNERDTLGNDLPPDYLTSLGRGDFFGWPYAYIGPNPDPVWGRRRPDLVAKTKTPQLLFQAHSAPLGLVFYDGAQFPNEYRGDAFVALHGPGPYDKLNGYKVVRVKFANGKPTGAYEDFLTGFLRTGEGRLDLLGQPAGLAMAKDGSLLVADDLGGVIWRVTYRAAH
jgi:glucose/arabinose dehydrogenase